MGRGHGEWRAVIHRNFICRRNDDTLIHSTQCFYCIACLPEFATGPKGN